MLESIKKMLGLPADVDTFDTDIVTGCNTALFVLYQIGVFDKRLLIEEVDAQIGSDKAFYELVKQYLYLKTRLSFDPPSNSTLLGAIKDQIKELEWRLQCECDKGA